MLHKMSHAFQKTFLGRRGQRVAHQRGSGTRFRVRWATTFAFALPANGGAAFIGEIDDTDGCDGGKEKRGTFAVWRGPRTVTTIGR